MFKPYSMGESQHVLAPRDDLAFTLEAALGGQMLGYPVSFYAGK